MIQVRDRGCGIAPEYHDQVFEPFYRVNHANDIPGIGLGLTIVKTCVDICNGQVSLESALNQGTTVTVTLPQVELSEGQRL